MLLLLSTTGNGSTAGKHQQRTVAVVASVEADSRLVVVHRLLHRPLEAAQGVENRRVKIGAHKVVDACSGEKRKGGLGRRSVPWQARTMRMAKVRGRQRSLLLPRMKSNEPPSAVVKTRKSFRKNVTLRMPKRSMQPMYSSRTPRSLAREVVGGRREGKKSCSMQHARADQRRVGGLCSTASGSRFKRLDILQRRRHQQNCHALRGGSSRLSLT